MIYKTFLTTECFKNFKMQENCLSPRKNPLFLWDFNCTLPAKIKEKIRFLTDYVI